MLESAMPNGRVVEVHLKSSGLKVSADLQGDGSTYQHHILVTMPVGRRFDVEPNTLTGDILPCPGCDLKKRSQGESHRIIVHQFWLNDPREKAVDIVCTLRCSNVPLGTEGACRKELSQIKAVDMRLPTATRRPEQLRLC